MPEKIHKVLLLYQQPFILSIINGYC